MAALSRTRSHWVIVCCCLLAVAASTAAAVSREPAPPAPAASGSGSKPATTAGTKAKATAPPSGSVHTLSFGMAYGNTLIDLPAKTLDARLQDAVALGGKWIRVDLPWSAVQPQSGGSYRWSEFDPIAEAAQRHGLKIDATLGDVPAWARSAKCRHAFSCPPADDDRFAAFAAAAARHYGPMGVSTWEIWNEPNIEAWAPGPDPAAYEKLLAATATALRAAQPGAFIMLGGLAAPPEITATRMSAYTFLTDIAKLGGTKYVDAVGYHPYSADMPSTSANFAMISDAPQNLESVLQRYGTPKVQIWLNETGQEVPNERTNQAGTDSLSKQQEQAQAQYAANLVQTVAANSYVAADFWYSDVDDTALNLEYGLHRADGSYRPVFSTLKEAIGDCDCDNGR